MKISSKKEKKEKDMSKAREVSAGEKSKKVSLSLSTHIDTLSAFFDSETNIPPHVTDAFRAVQSLIRSVYKSPEQYVHERSLVIQGIPELPPGTSPAFRQMDGENKVMEILDVLGIRPALVPCLAWVGRRRSSLA
ncbi:hypothetical protein ANCDUO_22644 [Ancylostoma duodenale]|uniref:Uncharacterized protein n=1 Tax=Ancylostoma duodenale TaxID=51022 RepID=A0A0C2BTP7_9BILA|nr:hypothetical protein ANCDUO_22644 [Ancylostoma duodenale]